MSDHDETQMYDDLIGFLMSERADLRLAATEAVLAVRDRQEMEKLIRHGIVNPLLRLCSYPDQVGANGLQALLILSSQGTSGAQCVEDLMDAGALRRMAEIALSQKEGSEEVWKKRVNNALALLANITRTERGALDMVGKQEEPSDVPLPTKPTLELLLARFLSNEYIGDVEDEGEDEALDNTELDSQHHDPYQHFAAVLMNSTQIEAGRKFVLRIRRNGVSTGSVLQAVLPQLQERNPIRRRGVAGTIKNCCLEKDSAWWILEEVKIVKHILYPLAGPEELDVEEKRGLDPEVWLEGPDKVREPDHLTRLFLVESILLLCASGRRSRERLRLDRVYVILKLADMVEDHEDVSERINECVQFLRRDESGTEDGSSDRLAEKTLQQSRMALPMSSTASQVQASNDDYDDVD